MAHEMLDITAERRERASITVRKAPASAGTGGSGGYGAVKAALDETKDQSLRWILYPEI